MGDMPIGACVVCEEQIDFDDAGVCGECGKAFCWSRCGGWAGSEHRCNNCGGDEDES